MCDGSNSVSNIQDYFEYIKKKHNEKIDNLSIKIYENRITLQIKIGYYLEALRTETKKLPGSTESKITKDKNGKNVPCLEVMEVVLVHCNIVNNDCQNGWRVLYPFVPNK